jgi:hypothetical protein
MPCSPPVSQFPKHESLFRLSSFFGQQSLSPTKTSLHDTWVLLLNRGDIKVIGLKTLLLAFAHDNVSPNVEFGAYYHPSLNSSPVDRELDCCREPLMTGQGWKCDPAQRNRISDSNGGTSSLELKAKCVNIASSNDNVFTTP